MNCCDTTKLFLLQNKTSWKQPAQVFTALSVHNHVKLEIHSFAMNFNSGYCSVWWMLAMGLADLLGIADLHCQKVESTKWLKHKLSHVRWPIV